MMYIYKLYFRRVMTSALRHSRKSEAILSYFESSHMYNQSPHITALKSMAVKELSQKVDFLLCSRLNALSTDNVLNLLTTWASTRPQTLPTSVFYSAFITSIRKELGEKLPWNHLVQTMHLLGFLNGKGNSKSLMIALLHCVDQSHNVFHCDFRDICIICEAAYRTSTAISSHKIRCRILKILEDDHAAITIDPIWLVMLIKAMTLSKFYDLNVLKNISKKWVSGNKIEQMEFTVQCYIMSFYAQAALRETKLIEQLSLSAETTLKDNSERIRLKDVSRLLWSLSHLNVSLRPNFMQNVVNYLVEECNNNQFSVNIIIQCCISLWILGELPYDVCQKVLTTTSLASLKEKCKNQRDLSRFALLLAVVGAEFPTGPNQTHILLQSELSSMKLLMPNILKEIKARPYLSMLKSKLKEFGAKDIEIEYPVLIYLAGVTFFFSGTQYHADILDPSVCLANENLINGRLKGKTRLLQIFTPNLKHIMVPFEDIQNLTKGKIVKC